MNDRNGVDIEALRSSLETRKTELAQRNRTTGDSQAAVELDQTRVGRLSRMDALQGQAMAQETERRRKLELQRIEAALERLDTDEYGYCVACGERISVRRLELDPAVTVCIDCAKGGRR